MLWTRILLAGIVATAAACDGKDPPTNKVDKAASIAIEVKRNPDDAENILAKHGMSPDEFESLMFDIAEDPEATREFEVKVSASNQ